MKAQPATAHAGDGLFGKLYIGIALAVMFFLGEWFALHSWTDILVSAAALAIMGAVFGILKWAGFGRVAGRPHW